MSLAKRRGGSTTAKLDKRAGARSLSDLARQTELRLGLDNDVFLRVAENLIYLRRYRGLTQHDVARRMETSQAAVARIEGARENITLRTFEKALAALRGRLQLSIAPAEVHLPVLPDWWELMVYNIESTQPYTCTFVAKQGGDPVRLGALWQAPSGAASVVGSVTVAVPAVPRALPSLEDQTGKVA